MTEVNQNDCQEIGVFQDGNGQIGQIDLKLIRGDREVYLSVGTRDYIKTLRQANQSSSANPHYDVKIFTLPHLEDVCAQLKQIPDSDLAPFIESIEDTTLQG